MTLDDELILVKKRASEQAQEEAEVTLRFSEYDSRVRATNYESVYNKRAKRLRALFMEEAPEKAREFEYVGAWVQGGRPRLGFRKEVYEKLNDIADKRLSEWW